MCFFLAISGPRSVTGMDHQCRDVLSLPCPTWRQLCPSLSMRSDPVSEPRALRIDATWHAGGSLRRLAPLGPGRLEAPTERAEFILPGIQSVPHPSAPLAPSCVTLA